MAGGKGRRHPGDLGREALLQGAGALGFAPMMKKDKAGASDAALPPEQVHQAGSPGHSRLRAPPPRHPDSSTAGKQGTVYSHLPFSSQ